MKATGRAPKPLRLQPLPPRTEAGRAIAKVLAEGAPLLDLDFSDLEVRLAALYGAPP